MTDLERVTKLAEECGMQTGNGYVSFTAQQFKDFCTTFEQAVLAKRDEEHEAIRKANIDSVAWVNAAKYEIESLQAKLAQQAEKLEASRLFLESVAYLVVNKVDSIPDSNVVTQTEHSIIWQRKSSAMWKIINDDNEPTQADVESFMAKKKAEWEKGVLEEAAKKFDYLTGWVVRDILLDMAKERREV